MSDWGSQLLAKDSTGYPDLGRPHRCPPSASRCTTRNNVQTMQELDPSVGFSSVKPPSKTHLALRIARLSSCPIFLLEHRSLICCDNETPAASKCEEKMLAARTHAGFKEIDARQSLAVCQMEWFGAPQCKLDKELSIFLREALTEGNESPNWMPLAQSATDIIRRPTQLEPRSYQEFDPYPSLCHNFVLQSVMAIHLRLNGQ